MSTESIGGGSWDDDDDHYHRRYYDNDSEEPQQPKAPATFDGLKIAEAEPAQLETALKKRMSALLKGNLALSEARTAMYTARGITTGLTEIYEKSKELPHTGDADALGLFFAQSQDRYVQAVNAEIAQEEAEWREHCARTALAGLVPQMTEALTAIKGARADMADAVIIKAAEHLVALVEKAVAQRSGNAEAKEPHPCDELNQELYDGLMAGSVALAVTIAEARNLIVPTTDAKAQVELCRNCNDIVEPTRPTEEEVQRYLAQLEARTVARQKSHQVGHKVFAEQVASLAALVRGKAELDALYAQFEAIEHAAPQLVAAAESADVVRAAWQTVHDGLQAACNCDANFKHKLDTTVRPSPSAAESKQIATMRIGLREVAYSMGRLNEATASQKATMKKSEITVHRIGVNAAGSFDGALAWLEDIKAQTEEAAKQNRSREVKLELLAESVAAYKDEAGKNKKALHQLVITSLPRRGEKPCDELRALLNAAAWMYESLGEREGAFPVY